MSELRLPKFNEALISGRIANDIEKRYTANGTPVVKFTLAVDKSFKDASGNWQNQAIFLDCVAWKDTAEKLNANGHKGSAVIVKGHLDRNDWEKDGVKHKQVDVIADYIQYLDVKPASGQSVNVPEPAEQPTNDDVPFQEKEVTYERFSINQ